MKFLIIALNFFLINFLFGFNVREITFGSCNYYHGACLCYSIPGDDVTFLRDNINPGLWAFITDINRADTLFEYEMGVFNSKGELIDSHKFKIKEDNWCCNKCGFPRSYAFYEFDETNNEWVFETCLEVYGDLVTAKINSQFKTGTTCCIMDCDFEIGHYTYKFFVGSEEYASKTFWIGPDFLYFDKFDISIKRDRNYLITPEIHNDGNEWRQNPNQPSYVFDIEPEKEFILQFLRCPGDWEGANVQITDHRYSPSKGSRESGHHFHQTPDFEYTFRARPASAVQNWFGNLSPLQGTMNEHSKLQSTWNVGNVSGIYKFKAKVSKNFDGRNYETEEIEEPIVGIPDLEPLCVSNVVFKDYLPTDVHIEGYNRYMHPSAAILMELAFSDFNNWLWENYPERNGAMMRLTDASLPYGGIFDGGGSGDNWIPLHSRHRLGLNADFSQILTDGSGLDRTQREKLDKIVKKITNNEGFCWYENNNHYHCRFFDGSWTPY